MVPGQGRVQEGARAPERDPARGVVQLAVVHASGELDTGVLEPQSRALHQISHATVEKHDVAVVDGDRGMEAVDRIVGRDGPLEVWEEGRGRRADNRR